MSKGVEAREVNEMAKLLKMSVGVLWCGLVAATPSLAAPITFSGPIAINGNVGDGLSSLTSQNSVGPVIGAVNFGPMETTPGQSPQILSDNETNVNIPTSVNIAGIDFVAVNTAGSVATTTQNTGRLGDASGSGFTSVDANFQALLRSNVYDVTAPLSFNVVLNGLTAGDRYEVQLFSVRGFAGINTFSSPDGGNTATVDVQSFSYVIGRFTASAATQTITVAATSGNAYLSALVLRRRVPELSSSTAVLPLCCVALAVFGLIDRRKKCCTAS